MTNYINTKQIKQLDRLTRLNLINSISGIKNVHLIATKSKKGISNLSIINSVVHIGSNPPLLGFVNRPATSVRRDTINNLNENPFFTINNVEKSKLKNAHLTSGKYPHNISEFKECGFTEEYVNNFHAPYVKESNIKIGLELREVVDFSFTTSKLIVGELVYASFCKKYITKNKTLNLENSESVFVSGLNDYYLPKKIASYPYVRK